MRITSRSNVVSFLRDALRAHNAFNHLPCLYSLSLGGLGCGRGRCRGRFWSGAHRLGIQMDRLAARTAFDEMDENKGGYVLFDEFFDWVAKKNEHQCVNLNLAAVCAETRLSVLLLLQFAVSRVFLLLVWSEVFLRA